MDPRIAIMVMQARMREQMQLEMQRKMQLEAQIWQGMTEEQRDRMREQQRMRTRMMATYQGQMMAEHIRMAGNRGREPMLPMRGVPFQRGPLFFPGQMGGPSTDPRTRPRTTSADGHSASSEPSSFDPSRASPTELHASVRDGWPGVAYGEWEVEDVTDEK